MPATEPGVCARCGRDPAAGYARHGDRWYCHGDDERPSCFELTEWDGNKDAPPVAVATALDIEEHKGTSPEWWASLKAELEALEARLRAEGKL